MPKLGVNIDHIATLRQARRETFPDPVKIARICEQAGADSVVCHLRQDRRHIQDRDLSILKRSIKTKLNLEMSITPEIVEIALKIRPDQATLVPERRQELTTEGGLDVIRYKDDIKKVAGKLSALGIVVSLFVDPMKSQIQASKDIGAPFVELHTGMYANAKGSLNRRRQLARIRHCADYAHRIGLRVNAGHGLDYNNVSDIIKIPVIEELNIGFAIVAESVFVGMAQAVKRMRSLIG